MRQAPENPYMRDELMEQMETAPPPTKQKASGRLPPSGAVSGPYQPEAPAAGAGSSAFGSLAGNAASLIHGNAGPPLPAAAGPDLYQPTGKELPFDKVIDHQVPPAAAGAPGATAGRYSGFDTQRAQDPTTSAKDAFYAASTRAGSMPSTKDDAEAWFNQFIKADLEAQGYTVDWVEGDKAFVRTRENPQGEVIDFLIDAGGENPMLGWQSSVNDPSITGGPGAGPQVNPMIAGGNPLGAIDKQIADLTKGGLNIEDIIAALRAQGGGTPPAPTGA